jgi:raffinose/stachyose/melibiose transport system permease protein
VTGRPERLLTYAVLGLATVWCLLPMVEMLWLAVQPDTVTDSGLTLTNFGTAWTEGGFGRYLLNSGIVSVSVVVLATLLSCLAGYAFGTMAFPGSTALFYLLLVGLMVPSEAVVVPLYFTFSALHLTDTYVAVIAPQVAQSLAFGTFWMRAYFRSTPRELVEATRLDGAGHWRALWSVLLPIGRPAIFTMGLLVFMWTWNEFLIPLVMVINDESLRTAPLGLANFQGQYTSGAALLAAGAVLVALPVVVVYVFCQRFFIRGMLEGAVKG